MNDVCASCGMPVTKGEYHPYAACLMYRSCHDSALVRASLSEVLAEGGVRVTQRAAISESEWVASFKAEVVSLGETAVRYGQSGNSSDKERMFDHQEKIYSSILDVVSALHNSSGVGEWCAPGPASEQMRRFLLVFDDADRGTNQYEDEILARIDFNRAESNGWNCHLFKHVKRRTHLVFSRV